MVEKVIYILLIFFFLICKSFAEIVKYDSSVFIPSIENWCSPFYFYNMARVVKAAEKEITIDLGAKHGVNLGLIYDIYHQNSKKPDARICINHLDNYTSQGYFIISPKFDDPLLPGDRVLFTGLIEDKENISYRNREEKDIEGIITLVEEEVCFFDIRKYSGIKSKQIFTVFNEKNESIGEIEIIEASEKKDSIGLIKNKKEAFKAGSIIRNRKLTGLEWLNLAKDWLQNSNTTEDAFYAYRKAMSFGVNIKNIPELESVILSITQKYEKEGDMGKSALYWNICKKTSNVCEENYKFVVEKAFEQGKLYWNKGEWIEAIKSMENLPKNEETQRYLSASYNYLGSDAEEKNHQMAIYCYEQAVNISPTNIFAIKNAANLYFHDLLFDKAILWVKNLKDSAVREEDKNWANIKEEEIIRAKEKRCPNYPLSSFTGKSFSVDSLLGNVVLMILWNARNFVSKAEIDFLKSFYEKNKDKKFVILAIHSTRESEIIRNFLFENGVLGFDIVFADSDMPFLFNESEGLPQNVILDKKGKVVYRKIGLDENELKNVINGLLQE
ncbi:TlpA family protein disulfide reductase [Candidatus Desantisbacteria bacterium]|nr:TlpA family protein disulfide reductase [Candidatus Desantisbacteria bacterium]